VRALSGRAAGALLERVGNSHVANLDMWRFQPTSTRIRRALACGESVAGFDDRDAAAVKEYEAKLVSQGAVDFEAMVLRSVDLVQTHPWTLVADRGGGGDLAELLAVQCWPSAPSCWTRSAMSPSARGRGSRGRRTRGRWTRRHPGIGIKFDNRH